jgi:cephalosporin-C deacetylase-like acetyl esterase
MRNGYGHMVIDHMVERVRRVRAERAKRLAALRTREDAAAYQAHALAAIARAFSPRPEKTPLNARVTGAVERSEYTIEKVIFESRPGSLVTANLYLPKGLDGPAPCVLGTCGHSAEGKGAPLYQAFAQRLAVSGFVTLLYDPVNQGERDQYALLDDREAVAGCTMAHNMLGKQLGLLGDSMTMWRTWDGIRALDYLLSRPEADPTRVGLTGNSGGGTMTTWLWAAEERFTMAAPSCFVTTFLANLENELPADSEQYPYGVIGAGLEMADLLIARAPKPIILLGQHYDYFDRRGHQEAYEDLRAFYHLLGAPEDAVACFRGPHPHGFFRENQEAMVAFFCRQVGTEPVPLPEPEVLDEATLAATPTGQVMAAGNKPVYAFIAEEARRQAAARPARTPQEIAQALEGLLHLPPREGVPHYRNLRPQEMEGGVVHGRYAVETEGDVRAILRRRMVQPEQANALDVPATVRLYLPHYSAEEELASDPLALALQEEGETFALDVRGLGESIPESQRPFWYAYGVDYQMHGYYLMLGESYLGRRVYDVLRTVDLVMELGAQEVLLYGRGQGAILALLAAMLDERIAHVTLEGAPASWLEWTETPIVDWPTANTLIGALPVLDLPDIVAALGDRVTVHTPWGPRMRPIAEE